MADGLDRDRRAAGPGRRDHRPPVPPDGHPGRPHARAARRDRHHLRIAAERDRRRGRAVPQGRQRDDPARRLRSDPQQPGDRRVRARRPARRRPAGTRGAGRRDHRPRGRRAPDRRREARRRHRPARRQGPHRAHRARREGPGDQAPRRRVPRVHRRVGRPRHGDPHRGQREDAALLALQHDGDAARARGHRGARAAAAVAASTSARASSCAAASARARWCRR